MGNRFSGQPSLRRFRGKRKVIGRERVHRRWLPGFLVKGLIRYGGPKDILDEGRVGDTPTSERKEGRRRSLKGGFYDRLSELGRFGKWHGRRKHAALQKSRRQNMRHTSKNQRVRNREPNCPALHRKAWGGGWKA